MSNEIDRGLFELLIDISVDYSSLQQILYIHVAIPRWNLWFPMTESVRSPDIVGDLSAVSGLFEVAKVVSIDLDSRISTLDSRFSLDR
jgi:hypothetical protein